MCHILWCYTLWSLCYSSFHLVHYHTKQRVWILQRFVIKALQSFHSSLCTFPNVLSLYCIVFDFHYYWNVSMKVKHVSLWNSHLLKCGNENWSLRGSAYMHVTTQDWIFVKFYNGEFCARLPSHFTYHVGGQLYWPLYMKQYLWLCAHEHSNPCSVHA